MAFGLGSSGFTLREIDIIIIRFKVNNFMIPIGYMFGITILTMSGTGFLSDTGGFGVHVLHVLSVIAGGVTVTSFIVTRVMRWFLP